MLGIRHFEGLAIDLWQGQKENFFCDRTLIIEEAYEKKALELNIPHVTFSIQSNLSLKEKLEGITASITLFLSQEHEKTGFHLAIFFSSKIQLVQQKSLAETLFTTVKDAAKNKKLTPSLRRLSFLVETAEDYQTLQEKMFVTFKEEDHEHISNSPT